MGGKLSTGVPTLDRRLGGGLNPGDILAVVAPPATQSQSLIYQFMKKRPTVYVTTVRSSSSIERDIDALGGSNEEWYVEEVSQGRSMEHEMVAELTGSRTYSGNSAVKDSPLDRVYEVIERVDGQVNVIIDPTNRLERTDERKSYAEVLKKFSAKMQDTGGVGICHCMAMDDPPALRSETLMFADVVWELDLVSTTKDKVEYQLRVPKNRTGEVILEVLSLEIGRRTVCVDDSRTI